MGVKKIYFPKQGRLLRADLTTYTSSNVSAAAISGSQAAKLSVAGATRPAESAVMAYACLLARREAIGSAPLMVTDRDDNEIEAGPLVDLLAKPNAEDNWDQYVRKLESNLTLWNVCAIHVGKPPAPPEQLVPLHPEGLTALGGLDTVTGAPRVLRWRYCDPTTAEQREFDADEVIVHMGFNPHSPLAALSPLRALDTTLRADLAAREQNLGLFLNDATPRGYLTTDQASTREQMEQLLDGWNAANKGYANRHKTAGLWGGLKYQRVELTPVELEFLQSLRQMRIDYYMVFRVYPAMLAEMTGETGLSQGSSTESQRVAWWEDVGLPELKLIASLHQQVADRFGRTARGLRSGRPLGRAARLSLDLARQAASRMSGETFVWFNDSAIPALWRMRTSRLDAFAKLLGAGYAPDDASDYLDLGLPPHPDNLPRMAFNLAPIGQETGKPPAEKQPAVAAAGKEQGEAEEEKPKSAKADAVRAAWDRVEEILMRAANRRPAQRRAFELFCRPREKAAARKISGFFVEQRGRVLGRLGGVSRTDQSGRRTAAGTDPAAIMRAEADDLVKKVFPRDEEDAQLVARLSGLWREGLKDGAAFFAESTGTNPLQIEANPAFEEALNERRIQGVKINATTEDDLRNVFREAFAAGDTVAQMGDRIAGYYKSRCVGEDSARPLTAARTQTAGLVNEGQMLAAREVGGLVKFWIHGAPDDPREAHVEAEERYAAGIPLDEKFVVNGSECDQPGDAALPVGESANCTCTVGFKAAAGRGESA